MEGSAFRLRVAKALVDEVATSSDEVLKTARDLETSDKFWDGVKGAFAATEKVNTLIRDLDLAIQICDAIDGSTAIQDETSPGAAITPSFVKAEALFHQGLVRWGRGQTKEALQYLDQSFQLVPSQGTCLNIALCFLQLREIKGGIPLTILGAVKMARQALSHGDKTESAVMALRKCIEIDSESPIGIEAGKVLARLGQLS